MSNNDTKTEKTFGELRLTFVDEFKERWNDNGSGADDNVSYWHPKAPQGWYALGSIGVRENSDYDKKVDGKFASLVVQAAEGAPQGDKAPLQFPKSYKKIWADKGSGANKEGSCWRPVPPSGYVALGDVFVKGYGEPDDDAVVCVREDLVTRGKIGSTIWKDKGSGSDDDFGSWVIEVPKDFNSSERGAFAPNTFTADDDHGRPNNSDVNWVLCLEVKPAEGFSAAPIPQLTSQNRPEAETDEVEDHEVLVPFTAIKDNDRDLAWKVKHSPFYHLRRGVVYRLEDFIDNDTSIKRTNPEVSYTQGISKTQTEEFHQDVGIEVSASVGFSCYGADSEVSTTVTTQMGWSSSTSVSEFSEQTITHALAAAKYTAVAMWSEIHKIHVYREDDTELNSEMEFPANKGFHYDEYEIPKG